MKTNVFLIAMVVLLAVVLSGLAHAELTITENWAVADAGKWGKTPVHTWDGEVPIVCDDPTSGTGFTWGGWVGLDPAKGKHFNINIDAEGKDRDGYVWWMGNPGPGGSFYTIFSSTGSNVADRYVENLDTVTVLGKSGDWVGQLLVRDANGDWYLSSSFDVVGGMTENTIAVSALTWEEIVGEPANDMNELDAGGPFEELTTKSNSDDGSGPGPLTADVTDENSTSPDLSKVTGAGFVWVGGSDSKFEFGPITWQGFEMPVTAHSAFPADSVLANPWDVALRWKTGEGVVGEMVYFGEDPNALADVTAKVVDNTYALGNLELGKTYYWRVDSEQADGTVLPPAAGTWRFSVGEYAAVDDFEGFTGTEGNRLFEVWRDGWGYEDPAPGFPGNGTGSTIGVDFPYVEQENVHSGGASLPFAYDNTGPDGLDFYSETERTLDAPQDWTGVGGRALTLYVYGDASASPAATDTIYVALEASAGNFADVHVEADLKLEEWQEINIALQDFTNVNLEAIKKLYLGVGDSLNPQSGGMGNLLFDDIRVYVPRCFPEKSGLMGDLNDDCIVDQKDMDILMAEHGLSQGDPIPFASGTLVTGVLDEQGRTEFTEDWDAHRDNQGRYKDFYAIAQENGEPILELLFPEGGFWKFPRVYTSTNSDFTGTTTATIQWRAKENNALALYGVANNAHDTYYRFKFVLYDNGVSQNLGWVPDRNGEYAPPENDGGRSPSYFPGLLNYQDLVTGMTFDAYCTLELTVVADDQRCTIDYTVKQGNAVKGSGTLTPNVIDFNKGIDQGQTATNWWIGGAYGKPDQAPVEFVTGGFVKSCDISSGAELTVDLNGDGVVDDLDRALIEAEMGGQQILWP